MNLEDIINTPRQTSFDFHAAVAQSWRRIGERELLHSPLIYSAFEYRLAIERFVFELYYLMKKENLLSKQGLSKKELQRIDSFSSLISIIYENSGNKLKLYRILSFNKAFSQVFTKLHRSLSIPDLGKLHKFWQCLSEYCHRQLEPPETWEDLEWVKKGYDLLNEVENYLWQICISEHFGWLRENSLPKELLDERGKYLCGEITESQLKTRMEIIKPVLEFKKDIVRQVSENT